MGSHALISFEPSSVVLTWLLACAGGGCSRRGCGLLCGGGRRSTAAGQLHT